MKNIPFIHYLFAFLVASIVIFVTSCQPDDFYEGNDIQLVLSTDTITFDTVFTNLGSTTDGVKILNPKNRKVNTTIELAGGNTSNFRINVNGTPGPLVNDTEILAEDSLYVFVEVTVDPNNDANPFIITDSLIITTNGNVQKVQLVAWGQNAIYLRDPSVFFWEVCDQTWVDTLPYVIFGGVYVPEGCTLNIEEGVDIYVHPKTNNLATISGFFVEGTLNVNGTKDSVVTFQGVRLEDVFDDLAAQWGALNFIRGSVGNFKHAEIKNGVWGLSVGSSLDATAFDYSSINSGNKPQIKLENTLIKNSLLHGIEAIMSDIEAENCLIYSCGENNVKLQYGGNYDFTHCTFANYGGVVNHRDPILLAVDFLGGLDSTATGDLFQVAVPSPEPMDMNFTNCIIHGTEDDEIIIANEVEGSAKIDFLFTNCLLETKRNIDTVTFVNCLKNLNPQDTLFINRFDQDYHIHPLSPAVDYGIDAGVPFDFDETPRVNTPDVGCYELQ